MGLPKALRVIRLNKFNIHRARTEPGPSHPKAWAAPSRYDQLFATADSFKRDASWRIVTRNMGHPYLTPLFDTRHPSLIILILSKNSIPHSPGEWGQSTRFCSLSPTSSRTSTKRMWKSNTEMSFRSWQDALNLCKSSSHLCHLCKSSGNTYVTGGKPKDRTLPANAATAATAATCANPRRQSCPKGFSSSFATCQSRNVPHQQTCAKIKHQPKFA